jgi:hypothetical protein
MGIACNNSGRISEEAMNAAPKQDLKISVAGCQLEEALYSPGPAQRHDDLVGVDVLDGLFAGQKAQDMIL